MTNNGDDKGEEVVCEFFGIKITTKNPNVARVLTTDIGKVMNLDVRQIKGFLASDDRTDDGETDDDEETEVEAVEGYLSSAEVDRLIKGEDE